MEKIQKRNAPYYMATQDNPLNSNLNVGVYASGDTMHELICDSGNLIPRYSVNANIIFSCLSVLAIFIPP